MNPNILRRAAAALRRGDPRPDLSDTLHDYARKLEARAPLERAAKSKKQKHLPSVNKTLDVEG